MTGGLTAGAVLEPSVPPGDLIVRKARMQDIGPILELINGYAAKGIMLPRTEFDVSEDIRDFSVILAGERLAGCGALHFYTPTSGEIRSLAVAESARTQGIGRRLIETLAAEASGYRLDAIFAFTYAAEFFRKVGFEEVERGELPLKVWKDCLRCPKFQCCDEIAVMRVLSPEYNREVRQYTGAESADLIQLPVLRRA